MLRFYAWDLAAAIVFIFSACGDNYQGETSPKTGDSDVSSCGERDVRGCSDGVRISSTINAQQKLNILLPSSWELKSSQGCISYINKGGKLI